MIQVRHVNEFLEYLAPVSWSFSFDHCGMQMGHPGRKVTGIVTTLDVTPQALDFALQSKANVIIAHHPLLFNPISQLDESKYFDQMLTLAIRREISIFGFHTNWDCAPGGISDSLAQKLELQNVFPFGSSTDRKAAKIVVFVPEISAEEVKSAAFSSGAGRIGNYDECSFGSLGYGTFRPLRGSNPKVGTQGHQSIEPEVRLEFLVPKDKTERVTEAIKEAHPYEEVALDIYVLDSSIGPQIGRMGYLASPMSPQDFVEFANEKLSTNCMAWLGSHSEPLSCVAVAGGAAGSEWKGAKAAGADIFLTGEIKHDQALSALLENFPVIQAGHFATEQPGMIELNKRLKANFKDISVSTFEPSMGQCGRPWLS